MVTVGYEHDGHQEERGVTRPPLHKHIQTAVYLAKRTKTW